MPPFSVPVNHRFTQKNLLFLLLAFTLIFSAQAQNDSKFRLYEYSFDKYGFKIPFYSRAEMKKTNEGKPNELVEYSFTSDEKYKQLSASLKIYPNAGCWNVDSFYTMTKRYSETSGSIADAYRVYMFGSTTGPFGWTYIRLSGGDNYQKYKKDDRYSRDVLAGTNGKIAFLVDVIFSGLNETKNVKQIMDEPGFSSLPLPVTLDKYKLKMNLKGNVAAVYNDKDKSYWIGRCDRLGTVYPYARLVKMPSPPSESEINKYLTSLKSDDKKTKIEYSEITSDTLLKNMKGKVFRVAYQEKVKYDEKVETQTQYVLYFFTIDGIGYKTELYVPFVKNDNMVMLKSDQSDIDEKSVPGFESRLREFIGTLRK